MKSSICAWIVSMAMGTFVASAQTASVQAAPSDRPYTPFMLSVVTPLQVPTSDFDVGGLRINAIYGECQDFDGLDISTVGHARGHANGLQAALIANVVDGDGMGLQVGSVNYVSGSYDGLQIGAVNYAVADAQSKAQALQIGFYNGSDYIKGMQIGVINVAREMIGVQIGVVNVIQNKDVSFLPIINCYF